MTETSGMPAASARPAFPSGSSQGAPVPGIAPVVVGAVVIVASLLLAVVLVVVGQQRADRAVEKYARAPAGCDTTIVFREAGDFTVFVETAGRLDGVTGECDVPEQFERDGDGVPRVQLSVFDPIDGRALTLERVDSDTYARAGFRGTTFRTVEVASPGTYVARVESPDGSLLVVAFGPHPSDVAGPWRAGALLAALLGVVVGGVLVAVGVTRRATALVAAVPSVATRPDTDGWSLPSAPPAPPPPPGSQTAPPGVWRPVDRNTSPWSRPSGTPLAPPSPGSATRRPGEWEGDRPITPPFLMPPPASDDGDGATSDWRDDGRRADDRR